MVSFNTRYASSYCNSASVRSSLCDTLVSSQVCSPMQLSMISRIGRPMCTTAAPVGTEMYIKYCLS